MNESSYARNYHILLINELVNDILEKDVSEVTKDIAVSVAIEELGKISQPSPARDSASGQEID